MAMEIMQQLAAAATATALCPEPSLMAMTTAGADGGRHRDAAWQEATPPRGLRQPRPPLAHPPPLPLVRPRLPPLLPPVLHPRPLQLAAGPPGFPPRGPRRRREPWRGRPGTGRGRSDGSGGGGDGASVYGAAGQGEEPAEAPACASMDATRLSSNAAGKRAGVGQDGFVRPGGMAVPATAAKMAPPSKVQVKEEPVDSAFIHPAGKRAGVGQDGFVRPGGMAVPATAAKMAPPSKVQVKEEPVDSDMRTGWARYGFF
uniref:Uncharacterized protein n=1 Tax=Oryza nivara TaxID=4536 RepID=A0A0E0HN54_ORYNI